MALLPSERFKKKGLTTEILDQDITFPFVMPPMTRYKFAKRNFIFKRNKFNF